MPSQPPRVVVVPGLGLDARSSAALRARVPGDVVLLPGMGLGGPVPPLETLAQMLRDRLGERPVVVVGHSQGCQVVTAAAGDDRVTGVVLLGPTTDPRLRRARGLGGRWLRTALAEPPRHWPLVVAQWLRTGPRAMTSLFRALAPDRIDARLEHVPVPVAVVRGTRDRLCDADWARRVADAAPTGRLVEIPGAAHMTVQTHPEAVADVLRSLLSQVT